MGKSGYVTPELTIRAKRKFIIDNCLEPQPYWDEWHDYRDGSRNWRNDLSKIKQFPEDQLNEVFHSNSKCVATGQVVRKQYTIKHINDKNKKLIERRKAMKEKTPVV